MTLEELQSMSDTKLNELAAAKVMGWNILERKNGSKPFYYTGDFEIDEYDLTRKYEEWKPSNYMNITTMELWNNLYYEGWELNLACDQNKTNLWECRMFLKEEKRVISHEMTAARAITIAAILAKSK